MEFVVGPSTHHLGVPLKDLKLKKGVLIAVIVRSNTIIIPEGSTYMQEGDTVIVVAKESTILDLNGIYAEPFGKGG
jgi:trk system potassium uptake protein TrkA